PFQTSIRIVVGTLLEGATLEHFACACQGDAIVDSMGNIILDPNRCGDTAWSDDPMNCSVCPGDAAHKCRCVDTDGNGKPDFSSVNHGFATSRCDATEYVSGEGEGFYYPNGNQFQSSVAGLAGLGPAIVVNTARPLPTNADCSVTVADSVKDHQGRSLV